MKTALFAVFSVFLAAIVYYFVFALVGMVWLCVLAGVSLWTTGSWFSYDLLASTGNTVGKLTFIYLPAFATGMLLTRAKPFFKPMVTAPLGVTAYWSIVLFVDITPPGWGVLAVCVGFVASTGLVTLLGAVVATKVSDRFAKPCAN